MSPRSARNSSTDGAAPPRPARRLVVSFHDLHPGSLGVARDFAATCAAAGVPRLSWLVVPRFHDGPAVEDCPATVEALRSWCAAGHDPCLHGWRHLGEPSLLRGGRARWMGTVYTAGEGEFQCLGLAEARRRVAAGLAMLRDRLGLPVRGFTPPAWLMGEEAGRAVADAGLAYDTRWGEVLLLREGRRLAAPTLVYSPRNAPRRLASLAWTRFWALRHARAPLLRLAVHPADFAHPAIVASIRRFLRLLPADREPVTYADLAPAA